MGDRRNTAYLGTFLTEGRGRVLVTATGMATEVGGIGRLLAETVSPRSPLEQRLEALGRTLLIIVLAVCAVLVLVGWLRGQPFWPMLEVGISLAIAAVPEGLPAVATITLALGMQRMIRAAPSFAGCPPSRRWAHLGHLHRQDRDPHPQRDDGHLRVEPGRRRLMVSGGGYSRAGAAVGSWPAAGRRRRRRPSRARPTNCRTLQRCQCQSWPRGRHDPGRPD